MHAGDLMVPEVIDWLEEVAPVMAVWGNGDFGGWERTVPPDDPRLSEAKVLTVGGGARNDEGRTRSHLLPRSASASCTTSSSPSTRRCAPSKGQMRHYFGGPVDVIVRGSTHAAEITTVKGVLIVNPGSPTFPNHANTRLGTIGFLEVEDGRVEARLVQLE